MMPSQRCRSRGPNSTQEIFHQRQGECSDPLLKLLRIFQAFLPLETILSDVLPSLQPILEQLPPSRCQVCITWRIAAPFRPKLC